MKFNRGDKVAQIMPAPIAGEVTGFDVDQETGALLVKVEWSDKDDDGQSHDHVKFFKADEIALTQ